MPVSLVSQYILVGYRNCKRIRPLQTTTTTTGTRKAKRMILFRLKEGNNRDL